MKRVKAPPAEPRSGPARPFPPHYAETPAVTEARRDWERSYEAASETEREEMIAAYHHETTVWRRLANQDEEDENDK